MWFEELTTAYKAKQKRLKAAINAEKRKCWNDICEEADPRGRLYKMVMNKIYPKSAATLTCPDSLDKVIRHLFPQELQKQPDTSLTAADGAAKPPEVTEAELRIAT